jgi:sodium-dependent dicarboxylate transporter 2/3/5
MVVAVIWLMKVLPSEVTDVSKARDLLAAKIQKAGKTSLTEFAVGIVLIVTVFCWMVFGHTLGLATIALASVVVLFVFRLVRWKDIEEYVNWGIILMYGGAITLGTALERSGAAEWIATRTIGEWGTSPVLIIALFSLITLLLTEGISNAAVIAILLPIGIGTAGKFGMDPIVVTYAIAVPAGLAFSLPMSTPANAIAVSSNYITVGDLVKSGVVMSITAWIAFNLVANYYWPLIGIWGK